MSNLVFEIKILVPSKTNTVEPPRKAAAAIGAIRRKQNLAAKAVEARQIEESKTRKIAVANAMRVQEEKQERRIQRDREFARICKEKWEDYKAYQKHRLIVEGSQALNEKFRVKGSLKNYPTKNGVIQG